MSASRSSTRTCSPSSASRLARVAPVGPKPTIATSCMFVPSVQPNAGLLDHLAPHRAVLADERVELRGAAANQFAAIVAPALRQLLVARHLLHRGGEAV